jgi:hypothetical protein
MAELAPPPLPPRVALADGNPSDRMRFRLWQTSLTLVTILVTAWFITLGTVPAVLALLVAKHVLVAILVMGLGVDEPQPAEPWS